VRQTFVRPCHNRVARDGRRHVIHYSIAEDTGMIGASRGIGWCIVGLDRDWSYNPACKMARPDSAEARRNQSQQRSKRNRPRRGRG
jgi:hypothetical protein